MTVWTLPASAQVPPLPDFLQTGVRLIYEESEATRDTRTRIPSAGIGLSAYDVVAVTPDRVLMNKTLYPQNPQGRGYTYGTIGPKTLQRNNPVSMQDFYYPPNQLAQLTSGGLLTVARTTANFNGQPRRLVMIDARDGRNVVSSTYDADTGLLLLSLVGIQQETVYKPSADLKRRFPFLKDQHEYLDSSSSRILVGLRQLPLPWLKDPAPQWTSTIQQMEFRGPLRDPSVAGPPIIQTNRVSFGPRGNNWAIARQDAFMQAPVLGVAPQHVGSKTWNAGPGGYGSLWISPQALARMKPGIVDQDPTLQATLAYTVQDGHLGRLGVLTLTDATGQPRVTSGYNLQTGMLVYLRSFDPKSNRLIELQLVGSR